MGQDLFSSDKTLNRELDDHLESTIVFLKENRQLNINQNADTS
jgi:hypothetical protein